LLEVVRLMVLGEVTKGHEDLPEVLSLEVMAEVIRRVACTEICGKRISDFGGCDNEAGGAKYSVNKQLKGLGCNPLCWHEHNVPCA